MDDKLREILKINEVVTECFMQDKASKQKYLILKVDGEVEVKNIDGKVPLEEMQAGVGGFIEVVYLPQFTEKKNIIVLANEEGLLMQLQFNMLAKYLLGLDLVGDIILINRDQLN